MPPHVYCGNGNSKRTGEGEDKGGDLHGTSSMQSQTLYPNERTSTYIHLISGIPQHKRDR